MCLLNRQPNPPLKSDPACIAFRSLSTFRYLGSAQSPRCRRGRLASFVRRSPWPPQNQCLKAPIGSTATCVWARGSMASGFSSPTSFVACLVHTKAKIHLSLFQLAYSGFCRLPRRSQKSSPHCLYLFLSVLPVSQSSSGMWAYPFALADPPIARGAPNLSLKSDPACIAFRSLSTSRYLGSAHRLGAGVAA